MFQFLLKQIEPTYRFTKSTEHEIYSALKLLKYPYLETVSKSQISAVGGQNWPVFLGIIHYLVVLNVDLEAQIDLIDSNIDGIFEAEEEELEGEGEREGEEKEEDRIALQSALIVNEYVDKAYVAFMNEVDDFIPLQEEMREKYQRLVENHKEKIQEAEREGSRLQAKFQETLKEAETIDFLERKKASLSEDSEKLRVYIESLTNRKSKWAEVLQRMKAEQARVSNLIEAYDKEKEEIVKSLEEQGTSTAEIDQIANERERTSKAIDDCVTDRDDLLKLVQVKQTAAEEVHAQLQELSKAYNQGIYTISSALPERDFSMFQLKLDNLLSDERLGSQTEYLLPALQNDQINSQIQEIQQSIKLKLHETDEQNMTLQEQNELIWEKINNLTEQMDQLEIKKQRISTDIMLMNDNLANDTSSYNAEIERYQKEIKDLETNLSKNMATLSEHVANVDEEYVLEKDRAEREVRELQQRVNYQVMDLLQYKSGIEGFADALLGLSEEELQRQEREMEQDREL